MLSDKTTRAAPGPSCWYPNYYCSVTEGNTDTPVLVTGGPSECYTKCQADSTCKFFTWISRRGVEYCYKLKECGSDFHIKDDKCLTRDSCYSGPRDCTDITLDNANCTKLIEKSEQSGRGCWQCEDGSNGMLINGYGQDLTAGSRCLQSCSSWVSHRWRGKSPVTYPSREKGYVFSECLANGSWSHVQTNDFTDGAKELKFPSPSNNISYPKPDEGCVPCTCAADLVLIWPPVGVTDLAVGIKSFTYNPRDEDGATMECEDEVQNSLVWEDKEFRVFPNNTCRFLCDDYLVATVTCVDGKWSGGTDLGFWCYNFPEWEKRLEGREAGENVLLIAGGSDGSPPFHSSVEVYGRVQCSIQIPDLPQPTKCLNTVYFNNSVLACNGFHNELLNSTCFKLEVDGWQYHSDTGFFGDQSSSVVLNDKLYIIGGVSESKKSVVMSANSPTWSEGPGLTKGLMSGCAVPLEDSFVIIGGDANMGQVEEYNQVHDTWTSWPALTPGRKSHGCLATGHRILVAGGNTMGSGVLKTTIIINTKTKAYSSGPSMKRARTRFLYGNVNGLLVMVGGEDQDATPVFTKTGELFDMDSGSEMLDQELVVARGQAGEAAVVPIQLLDSMFGCP